MATGVVVCVSSTRAARSPAAKLSLPTGPSDLQPAGSAGPPPPTESPLIWAQLGRRVSPSAVNANITDVLEAFAPEQQVPHWSITSTVNRPFNSYILLTPETCC